MADSKAEGARPHDETLVLYQVVAARRQQQDAMIGLPDSSRSA